MTRALTAVLFDMDGLLVDTEPEWFIAESMTAAWLGVGWTLADQHALLGTNLEFAADYLISISGTGESHTTVMNHLRSAMSERLRVSQPPMHKGAQELIDELQQLGVPIGLVTSSVREHVDIVLRELPAQTFAVRVTADDVVRRKPHPDPYLLALAGLKLSGTGVVVLEDSPPGVLAAEAAGCRVVAVPSVTPVEATPLRLVASSLADLAVSDLDELAARITQS